MDLLTHWTQTSETQLKEAIMTAIENAVAAGIKAERIEEIIQSLLSQKELSRDAQSLIANLL